MLVNEQWFIWTHTYASLTLLPSDSNTRIQTQYLSHKQIIKGLSLLMTRLKRETDLQCGEALYCLASLLNFFVKMPLSLCPGAQNLAGFHCPTAIYEAFQLAGSICTDMGSPGQSFQIASVLKREPKRTRGGRSGEQRILA